MSDKGRVQDGHNEDNDDDDCSRRSFDEKVVIVDTCFKRNFTTYHIIARLEKEVRKLTKELPLIRKEIAEGFGDLRTHNEPRENKSAGPSSIIGCGRVDEKSTEARAYAMHGPGKVFDGKNNDVVALKSGIDRVVERLEKAYEEAVAEYEQKLRNKDQFVECIRNEKQALEKIVAEKNNDLDKLRDQITTKESEIDKLKWSIKNCEASKEEDVKNLKYLLQLAGEKLEKRLERMQSELITEVKESEATQKNNIQAVGKSVIEIVSNSLADLKDQLDCDHITRKINDNNLPDFLTRLKQLYKPLSEKLSAKPVAAELFQGDVLSLAELEKVQCSHTPTEAAECLIGQILSKRSDVSYNCFLTALMATVQGHIVLWLTYDDFNIDSQHADLIRQNYIFLLKELSPKDSGLIALLFQQEVIDQRENEILESVEGAVCQAESLLAALSRKSKEQFEKFLDALDHTGQSHVAEKLRRDSPASETFEVSDATVGHETALAVELPGDQLLMPSTSSARKDPGSCSVTDTTVVTSGGIHNRPHLVSSRTATEKAGKTLLQKFFTPRSKSVNASVTHVIAAHKDRKGHVKGLTVHGEELYVVRLKAEGVVEVYNATNFTFKRNIKLEQLEGLDGVHGLTSCDCNNCLYVGYWRHDAFDEYVAKVELTGKKKVVKWKVKDKYSPLGLSVNSEHNLIVTCYNLHSPHKLIEYTTRGKLVREILLQDNIVCPRYAIQLISGQFLVSHGSFSDANSLQQVCVIDADGRVLVSYGNKRGSESGRLNCPQQLAVDGSGFVFVADYDNDRIVVLDWALKWSRDLQIVGDHRRVKNPCSLCLDERRNLLFVGESDGDESRVVIVPV